MPSRRKVQPSSAPRVSVREPSAAKRPAGLPMLPAILATTVGTARHDRHMAGTRLGASRRLGAQMRAARQATLTPQERQRYLEDAAYYHYLQRGDGNGSPEGDWYAAEQQLHNRA